MTPIFWISAGHFCVLLGVAGIFLPLLPTTPFLLLASYCYSKGSSRFNNWLLTHPRLGSYVLEWRKNHAIPFRAKLVAVALICTNLVIIIMFVDVMVPVKFIVGIILSGAIVFIVTRPDTPKNGN